MNEVEKMRSGQLADMSVPEMQVRFEGAQKLLARMRGLSTYDGEYRRRLFVRGACPVFPCHIRYLSSFLL